MKKIFITIIVIVAISGACTIAVIAGEATNNGHPLIFKNRDITNWDTEFKVLTPDGYYAYVINSYYGSSSPWMGINEVGFGIVQSAAYNIDYEGGWGLGNATLMEFALKRCETIAEFETILDSTDITGRSTGANYAVIDAHDGAAMFEVANWEHLKYEPDSLGIVVRANYSYIGDDGRTGIERYNRAYRLLGDAALGDSLDALFVANHLIADLYREGEDPYPLPWTGAFDGLPAGWVNTGSDGAETISNWKSLASCIAQGVSPDMPQELALMWCCFATPAVSIPFPIFPASHTQPDECIGNPSVMLELTHAKYDSAFTDGSNEEWFDTRYLLDETGSGIWNYILPTTAWAFDTVEIVISSWIDSPPSALEMAEFQDTVMQRILHSYMTGTGLVVNQHSLLETFAINAYPNPFNTSCRIHLSGFSEQGIKIEIFDLSGTLRLRSVPSTHRSLNGAETTTDREFIWQPDESISSGTYFIKVTAGAKSAMKQVIFLK